jgi:iron complex outermembrane receptor protein
MRISLLNHFVLLSAVAISVTSSAAEQAQQSQNSEATDASQVPTMVVTATRIEQSSFDLPVSIDRIDKAAIQNDQPMVNLSETLSRVPGLVAQNRQNYAQDLQISSRGFGARSTFGVRGLRMYADGIPATMPDGQGQVSNIDLGSASRIEIMRGPFSALYGNSSGGVISVFTEDGLPGFTLTSSMLFGSYGMHRYGLKASGQEGTVNYVIDTSRFKTDGYRDHSAATRDTENAKLRISLDADSTLTLIGNAVQMRDVQDALGLSRAQFDANPRGVDPGAITFNARKSVTQQQGGAIYERALSASDRVSATVYTGQRETTQFQSIPTSAQIAATSAGAVIDLARKYWGTDVRWSHHGTLAGQPLQWTVGTSYENLDEDRKGYQNFVGSILGIQGALRRDEANNVYSFDQYIQAQWEPDDRWLLMGGVRNTNVHVDSVDHYIVTGNGNDSGGTNYHAFNPALGATFKLTNIVNLYASYGKGFETPTFNELAYKSVSGAATGLNFALKPSRSNNYEMGVKTLAGKHAYANLAIFHIDTEDELAVLANSGGRSVYQNAGKTKRDGAEASVNGNWANGIGAVLAYSQLRAVYADGFCSGVCSPATSVAAGNKVPGVPARTLYSELSWKYAPIGFHTALEGRYVDKVYVNDTNSDAASSYFVANIRAGFEQKSGGWAIKEFARVDNVTGRNYAGSVIVNESNQRYFEPAPRRNYVVGVNAAYSW